VGPRRRHITGASAELSLAVDCCKRSFVGAAKSRTALRTAGIDWQRFLQLVRFHRIQGLAWNGLSAQASELPNHVQKTLSRAASEVAARNLLQLGECRSLAVLFQQERIDLLFLKGLAVGTLAYGNAMLKSAVDVDLLIDAGDLDRAVRLLRDRGYHHVVPSETVGDELLGDWHRRSKESVWVATSMPFAQVDLHTRSADNGRLIPTIDVHSPRVEVEVGDGLTLPTLALDEQFAYLAVHGASSVWFRLKWIADLAGLLSTDRVAGVERLYHRSQELGAGRAAGQALLLADALFGTLASADRLRCTLLGDRATRTLFNSALALLNKDPVEPTARPGGTLPMHWTPLLLMPGLPYKVSEVRRQISRSLADRWA